MIDERKLILSVKSGSEKAYRTLYEMWVSRLYQFVYQYVKSEETTDDVVQETFYRIWINREKLDAESSFKAYLFTIAYHLLLKELRRQLNNTSMEEFIEYNDNIRTSGDEAEKQIDFDQFCKALKQAKEKLTPRQREIFELNKEQNLSVAEIAEQLCIKEQVVRNQLSTALKIIRTELQQYSFILLLFLSCFCILRFLLSSLASSSISFIITCWKIVTIKIRPINTTAIAAARPILPFSCAKLFIITKYVAVPKVPPVITYGGSNALNEPEIERIIFNTITDLILGSMI